MHKLVSIFVAIVGLGSVARADPRPPVIVVANLTLTPQVTPLADAVTNMDMDKLLRLQRDPECAYYVTPQPIALLDIKQPTPQLHVALRGRVSGMVVKLGHSIWTACTNGDDQTATLGKPAEGWQPGRYEIYAGGHARSDRPEHVELALFDPDYVSPADAAAAPTGPIELSLGDDMTKPVSTAITIPNGHARWYPVTVKTTIKRKVVVLALGDAHAGVGSQANGQHAHELDFRGLGRSEWNGTVKPDEPLAFDVYGEGGTKVYVVVAEPHATILDEHDVFGAPPIGAKAQDRRIEYYTLFPYLQPLAPFEVTRSSAEVAGRLFAALDPSLILWVADDDHCKHILTEGEPVILLRNFDILHANGQVSECRAWNDDELTTKKPAKVAIPKVVEPRSSQQNAIWSDEDFLTLADSDKQIASYKTLKDKARKCNADTWARLDPDGKSGDYDIVTYKNGKPDKIEGAADRIFRQVYDACKLSAIEKARDAIYKRLSKTFIAEEQRRLDAIATRFQ